MLCTGRDTFVDNKTGYISGMWGFLETIRTQNRNLGTLEIRDQNKKNVFLHQNQLILTVTVTVRYFRFIFLQKYTKLSRCGVVLHVV